MTDKKHKLTDEEIQYTIEQSKKIANSGNKHELTEEEVQYTIEQSKKLVNSKPNNDSSPIYTGRKTMIGFDDQQKK